MTRRGAIRSGATLAALFIALGCVGAYETPRAPSLAELRRSAPSDRDPEHAGLWLLGELLSPGGDLTRAQKARAHLDALGTGGMLAAFGRALDDGIHGRLSASSENYLAAVRAARDSKDERAPLIAWFATSRALDQSHGSPELWRKWHTFVEQAIVDPRALGWRARGELVEWAIDAAWARGETDTAGLAVRQYGCLTSARIAGPFGRGTSMDAVAAFPAEKPGAWPYRWEPGPGLSRAPRLLATKAHSCAIHSDERPGDGVFYVETFFDLKEPTEVLVAVQGALSVRVDDHEVLERDVREWGVWPRFGAALRLGGGRHRLVAKIGEPSTSIRLMRPDGTPLGIRGSNDPGRGYTVTPPEVLADPNVLSRFVENGRAAGAADDLTRFVGGFLAHLENSSDVASILMEPLLSNMDRATGATLGLAALAAAQDPIFEASQAKDLVRELHQRAVKKDPLLWGSRLSLAASLAERKGPEEAVPDLERLARDVPGVPAVGLALARLYGELGWTAEQTRAIRDLAARFPNHTGALHAAVDVLESRGEVAAADAILSRIRQLDRDDELTLARALAREDYAAAIAELGRLAKQHPERLELEERLTNARLRAGELAEADSALSLAVAKDSQNPRLRLALADSRLATGDSGALHRALADGVQAGSNPALLENAIDLVEGATALEPYRLDARRIIETYEKSGRVMEGTAARILDYAAIWVRADGSSRMLEHEIVRLQSTEAISTFAEHRALPGLVLHMRVIKKDGTTLEPEQVAGKPTVTFPHLEVGDYIETEQIVFSPGDGQGIEYAGPRWFFREENVGYARSEFVVISPESKNLTVETTGSVPVPVVETKEGLVSRRWRVDESPAAPSEPGSVPIQEFLPSVRIGWGTTLGRRLEALSDAMAPMTPVDPRIRRIAAHIVEGTKASDPVGRARRLYRWLLDNVEPGDETDGRRVVIGKRGNLWHGFRMLCSAAGISVRYAVAKSRLSPPPLGPLSEATLFTQPVALVGVPKGGAWLTLGNKYAPFGYLPAEVRGMPARFLDGDRTESVTIPEQGTADALAFSGHGKLDAKGALTIELAQEFSGKLAMTLRRGLSQVPEERLHDVLESNLLAQTLRGGELVRFRVERREDLDAPLVVHMTVKVPRFAQVGGKRLVIAPPLAPDLGRLSTLPSRKTPLLIGEALHRRVEVDIELPSGARVELPPPSTLSDGDRKIVLEDGVKGRVLRLRRTVALPAGRVQPDDYARFARFARQADDALSRAIEVRLP